jgi:hypothetical protein
MTSPEHGTSTSKLEVTNISAHGFWLFHDGKEYLLDYSHFPWFKKATVEQICHVELSHGTHLYWSDLDVDLTFNIIEHPDQYQHVSK